MSLQYAMLGFLQYKPISGYDMKKLIDTSIGYFWSADQSQIYRTLGKLTEEGLVEVEIVIQYSKPNSKIYHITDKGKEEFLNWLSSPAPMVLPRIPWLIQVFFAAQLPDDEIINIFKQIATNIREKIGIFNENDKERFMTDNDVLTPRDLLFVEITYECGLTIYSAILQWVEKAIERIENKEYLQK